MTLDPGPTGREQNDNTDLPACQILLTTKILVRGDEGVEPFRFSAGEQLPVLEVAPPFLVGYLDGVTRQMIT